MEAVWQVTLAERTSGTAVQAASGELDTLVREHARLVYRVAYSVLRNDADAEDAVQETFLRALRHQDELGGIADVRAWLVKIAWRIAIDRRPKSPPLDSEEMERRLAALPSRDAAADDHLARAQMIAVIEAALPTLPRKLREVLTLATVQELNSPEIAAVLGIAEGSVRTRLMRARQMLRDKVYGLLEGKR